MPSSIPNTEQDTFKPTIREGEILAGGLRIAEITPDGHLIFNDRYRRRCHARGTPNVPIDVCELVEAIIDHISSYGPQW